MKIFILIFFLAATHTALTQSLVQETSVRDQPYIKYMLVDKKKDTITFYLSECNKETELPLVVFIQGSGNQSLFTLGNNNIIRPNYGHANIPYTMKDKARVLIVEKPGVRFLDASVNNTVFDKLYSLESWMVNLHTAVKFVLKNEFIDKAKILVVGHSEGGVVAARLANKHPEIISHVSIVAGEGPSQLFSLYEFANKGVYFDNQNSTPKQRMDSLIKVWKNILSDPTSINKKFWGFTYLRWSSFLKTSVLEELLTFNGKIYIVQGDADKNVLPISAEVLYTTLLSKGKDVQLKIVEGADHSFNISGNSQQNGWEEVFKTLREWLTE